MRFTHTAILISHLTESPKITLFEQGCDSPLILIPNCSIRQVLHLLSKYVEHNFKEQAYFFGSSEKGYSQSHSLSELRKFKPILVNEIKYLQEIAHL